MRPVLLAFAKAQNISVVRSAAATEGLSGWIKKFECGVSTSNGKFSLRPHNPKDLAQSFASDCLRLSYAGRETLQAVRQTRNAAATHAAWSSIQIYYAAFYYTSALLRILGISNSFFQQSETKKLSTIASTLSFPQFPSKGLFRIEIDTRATSLELDHKTKNGTHEALWSELRNQIAIIRNNIPHFPELSSQDVLQAMDDLDLLEKASMGVGRTQNLSTVRNDVQYRQQLYCWHPNARAVKLFHKTDRVKQILFSEFNPRNILYIGQDYNEFFTKCLLICSFCHNLLSILSQDAERGTITKKYMQYHKSNA